jgi:tRNA (pseudouridine54-N1)-methyltransferase
MLADQLSSQLGSPDHFEVVLHTIMNAFFVASDFRENVELYLVFDSTPDFPRTFKLSSAQGLSLPGFHEQALLAFMQSVFTMGLRVEKNQMLTLKQGVDVFGYGLERLIQGLLETQRPIFLLDPKGEPIDTHACDIDPIFILSDHLMMPKNTVAGLKRRGVKGLSLGKKMLFASQCVVLLQHAWDQSQG